MFDKILKYGEMEVTYQNRKALIKKPKLYNLFWETTLRCNAHCKHCGSRAGENINLKDELNTKEIIDVFKSVAKKYNAKEILLNITGGEPLIREDIFEVMSEANQLGFKWGMTTNGILINDDIIKKMKETKIGSISISLDGLENSHDEFRGIKGSYSKIINNIKKIKKENFIKYIQVTTVVNKTNINELEELYKIIKDLNINSWRVVNMDPIGRAKDNTQLNLDDKDIIYLLDFIKDKRKNASFDVTYGCSHFLGEKYERQLRSHMFFCVSGYTTASILYNGDIYVCPNVERLPQLIQGNVRKDNFVDVWENKFKWFRNEDRLKNEECSKCNDWKYCKGDSLHTWNFEKQKPNVCFKKIIEGGK